MTYFWQNAVLQPNPHPQGGGLRDPSKRRLIAKTARRLLTLERVVVRRTRHYGDAIAPADLPADVAEQIANAVLADRISGEITLGRRSYIWKRRGR